MYNDGSGVRRVARFYSSQECQERGWVLGDSMVWPGGKLELSYFSLLSGTILGLKTSCQTRKTVPEIMKVSNKTRPHIPTYYIRVTIE